MRVGCQSASVTHLANVLFAIADLQKFKNAKLIRTNRRGIPIVGAPPMRKPTTEKPPAEAKTNALANFAKVFWDAALREVEARIDAEGKAPKRNKKKSEGAEA